MEIEKERSSAKQVRIFYGKLINKIWFPKIRFNFFKNFEKLQILFLFTVLLLLTKISSGIVEYIGFISYEVKEYSSGINLPELDIINGVEFADKWSDLILTIYADGKLKLNNIECTQEELADLFKSINAKFSTNDNHGSVEFKNRSLWLSINSNLIMIVDKNCEMSSVNNAIRNASKFGLNNLIFLTK